DPLYPDLAGAWVAVFGVTPTAFYDPGQPQKGVFTVQGAYAHELVGKVVEGVGDLNGDGAPDLALGSWFVLPNDSGFGVGSSSGMPYTYILFGKANLLEGGNAVLRRENFTEGIMIRGAGNVIAGGRDVNGDGV